MAERANMTLRETERPEQARKFATETMEVLRIRVCSPALFVKNRVLISQTVSDSLTLDLRFRPRPRVLRTARKALYQLLKARSFWLPTSVGRNAIPTLLKRYDQERFGLLFSAVLHLGVARQ